MADDLAQFKELLADPRNADNPLAKPLARIIERYERTERRLERVARMGDRFFTELRQTSEALRTAHVELPAEQIDAADYVRSMLPPPLDGRVRARWCFVPARDFQGGAVGYRWLPGGKHFAFFVVATSGKGVRAALLSLSVLNALHGRALPGAQVETPHTVLAALDVLFPAAEQGGLKTSVAYFVFDSESRQLRYAATEGVGAVYVTIERGVVVRAIEPVGPPIGLKELPTYTTNVIDLDADARVILYTRGADTLRDEAGVDTPIAAWAQGLGSGAMTQDLPLLIEQGARRYEAAGKGDCVVLEVEIAAATAGPPQSLRKPSSSMRLPWSSMDDAQELAWVETLLQRTEPPDPVDVAQLARRYVHLMRRLTKLTRISDAYQHELRITNRQIEEVNGDLNEFASRAAHDLKAPLKNVIGLAQLLLHSEEAADGAGARAFAGDIVASSQKMIEIIDSLLTLARVRHADIPNEPIDMHHVVSEAVKRLTPLFAATPVHLQLPPSWPAVSGNAPWVEAVWANYISNAIKYGGRPARVELGATLRYDGSIQHWVKDNGAGLDEAQRSRLFQPFTRLTERGEGHGLGLTIIRRIIERLGGSVGVDSVVGDGSTFWFTLPAADARPSTAPVVDPLAELVADARMAERHPLRLLVAEDNAVNQKLAMLTLAKLGYRPDVVPTGRQAVEAVLRDRYDIVFMDVHMPDVDGIDATRTIVSRVGPAERPRIVALTASATEEERQRCFEAGMSDCFSKPVSVDKFADALRATKRLP